MKVSNNYVAVEKLPEEKKEGFETVQVTDDFVYRGKVVNVPEMPVYIGNDGIKVGDTILFAKYSPDTHEIELDGKKLKFVSVRDIIATI